MPLSLTVDLESETVAIGGRGRSVARYRGQWVEFYAHLAVASVGGRDSGWITGQTVAQLTAWRRKKFDSVGKIVARHIAQAQSVRACVIDSAKVTSRWRLAVANGNVSIIPSVEFASAWLRDRGLATNLQPLSTEWLKDVTRALIALHLGEIKAAQSHAVKAFQLSDVELRCSRVAGLVLVRAAASCGEFAKTRRDVEAILRRRAREPLASAKSSWGHGLLGDYILTRLSALDALDSDAIEAEDHAVIVRTRLVRAEAGGDVLSHGVVHNVLGVLAIRTSKYSEAHYHFSEATIFALAASDMFTLGGILFNLALTFIRDSDIEQDRERGQLVEDLLMLAVEMDSSLAIGRNSAQTEILASRLLISTGRLGDAAKMLTTAGDIVRRTGHPYDAGCLAAAHAKFAWAKGVEDGDVVAARAEAASYLAHAVKHFQASGRMAWVSIEAQLRELQSGGHLSTSFYK